MEVGPVLALLRDRQVVPVGSLILLDHAVQVKEILDLTHLKAADGLALEGAEQGK